MSSLVFICLFFHYRFVLLPHYEPVPPRASVGYVQIILNDVAQASLRLVSPLISRVCHRFGHDLFLCCHKSIVTCASQLRLVVGHIAFYSFIGSSSLTQPLLYPGLGLAMLEQHRRSSVPILLCLKI
jgi:hypothetical protein